MHVNVRNDVQKQPCLQKTRWNIENNEFFVWKVKYNVSNEYSITKNVTTFKKVPQNR